MIFFLLCSPCAAEYDSQDAGDTLNCGTGPSMLSTGPVSVSAWVFIEGAGGNNTGNIISRTDTFHTTGMSVYYVYFSDTEIYLSFEQRAGTNVSRQAAGSALDGNVRQHIAITWDGSVTGANIKIYVNGTEVSSYNATGNGTTVVDNSAASVQIGFMTDLGRWFNGRLSEVATWNAVLTADDVKKLACAEGKPAASNANACVKRLPLQIKSRNLTGYWELNERPDGVSVNTKTYTDFSGNGHTCTGDDGSGNTGNVGLAEIGRSYPE